MRTQQNHGDRVYYFGDMGFTPASSNNQTQFSKRWMLGNVVVFTHFINHDGNTEKVTMTNHENIQPLLKAMTMLTLNSVPFEIMKYSALQLWLNRRQDAGT